MCSTQLHYAGEYEFWIRHSLSRYWIINNSDQYLGQTSLLLSILFCFSGCLSVCFSSHSINALVHAEKITHSIQKLEEYKRGKQYGSNFCVVVEWCWHGGRESFLSPICLFDWQPHCVITLNHFTTLFVQFTSTFVLCLLQNLWEGGEGREVKHSHKEREQKDKSDIRRGRERH